VASWSASCSTSLVLPTGSGLIGLLLSGILSLPVALASTLTLTAALAAALALTAALVETSSVARSLRGVAMPFRQTGTFGVLWYVAVCALSLSVLSHETIPTNDGRSRRVWGWVWCVS